MNSEGYVSSAEYGSSQEKLDVSYAGPPLEISFNARYLMDVAANLEGELCCFSFFDKSTAAIAKCENDESILFVIQRFPNYPYPVKA
jgi:DNA polymerase-3 subunit beta